MNEAKEYYNELAKKYDSYVPMLPQYRQLVNEIVNQIKTDKTSRILDVGVGTGFSATCIFNKHKSKMFGVDISEEMLKKCKKNIQDLNTEFILKKENNWFKHTCISRTITILSLQRFYHCLDLNFMIVLSDNPFFTGNVWTS